MSCDHVVAQKRQGCQARQGHCSGFVGLWWTSTDPESVFCQRVSLNGGRPSKGSLQGNSSRALSFIQLDLHSPAHTAWNVEHAEPGKGFPLVQHSCDTPTPSHDFFISSCLFPIFFRSLLSCLKISECLELKPCNIKRLGPGLESVRGCILTSQDFSNTLYFSNSHAKIGRRKT